MTSDLSRRYFLKVLAAGAATSAGALSACSGSNNGGQPEGFGDVSAGNISALAVDQVKPIPGVPAFIGRDSGGVYAMTSTCTHQGCDMAGGPISSSNHTISCSCHGSVFSFNGDVQRGPASSPLEHFKVDIATDGTITVHGATPVASSVRVAVA
jgi:cytochrome b6-f complex iron-sulfur subunit